MLIHSFASSFSTECIVLVVVGGFSVRSSCADLKQSFGTLTALRNPTGDGGHSNWTYLVSRCRPLRLSFESREEDLHSSSTGGESQHRYDAPILVSSSMPFFLLVLI